MNFNEEIRKTMGSKMREARKKKGLTQEEVAEICNLDDKHIGKLERGEKTPLVTTLFKYWKATDIDVNRLFQELDELERKLKSQHTSEIDSE